MASAAGILVAHLACFSASFAIESSTRLDIDTSAIIATTRDEYVSYNLDSTDNRNFFERNIDNPQLAAFAKDLSPSFIRVGGTGANELFYQFGSDIGKMHPKPYKWHWKHWNFTFPRAKYLNASLWDSVNRLAANSGAKLIFNVNLIQFVEDGGQNMRNLLEYSIQKGYRIHHIQPSNELGVPPVENLKAMSKLLTELYPDAATRPGIIGSDDGDAQQGAGTGMRQNAAQAGVPLFAANYHKYSNCDAVFKPNVVHNNTNFYSKLTGAELHIGEAATCGQGGHQGVSDTFASGFWYWQYLGRLAQLNHRVFLRQTLVGGYYGLLRDRFWEKTMKGDTLEPNVDYFSAVLFKRYMGNNVFRTSTPDDMLQAYAHCSRGKHGGLAVALINLDTRNRVALLHDEAGKLSSSSSRTDYLLTSDSGSPHGQYAKLNGGRAVRSVKDLVGKPGHGNSVTLAPRSYGVVVFDGADVPLCASASQLSPVVV